MITISLAPIRSIPPNLGLLLFRTSCSSLKSPYLQLEQNIQKLDETVLKSINYFISDFQLSDLVLSRWCEKKDFQKTADFWKNILITKKKHFTKIQYSDFSMKVWRKISEIPKGNTISYSQLAYNMGLTSHHARAVGQACKANPFVGLIPCHRIVAKNELNLDRIQDMTSGFNSGSLIKKILLKSEKNSCPIWQS
jgi:O-6-methylguanine DNA methyltransferase